MREIIAEHSIFLQLKQAGIGPVTFANAYTARFFNERPRWVSATTAAVEAADLKFRDVDDLKTRSDEELVDFLASYRKDALAGIRGSLGGAGPRTEAGPIARRPEPVEPRQGLSWEPLRPELVAEVAYEHMQGTRFRHMAHFRRWRTDKKPSDCTYAQLEVVPPQELAAIFATGR